MNGIVLTLDIEVNLCGVRHVLTHDVVPRCTVVQSSVIGPDVCDGYVLSRHDQLSVLVQVVSFRRHSGVGFTAAGDRH